MTQTLPAILIVIFTFGVVLLIVQILRKRAKNNYSETQSTNTLGDDLIVFECPAQDEPIEDPRIDALLRKIDNLHRQLRYWKGDVLKEAEYTGLINECQRSIDKIRKENNQS